MIPVYAPQFSVTLRKMVRPQASAAPRLKIPATLDLTPFLGESGAISVTKGIYDQAGGFSVTFPDKVEPQTGESLYTIIEPMDCIEIRAARSPSVSPGAGKELPVLMRGWVDTVRRGESMSDNSPQRAVVVQGRDAAKFWHISNVIFQIAFLQDAPFLNVFQMQAATGMSAEAFTVNEFMRQIVGAVNHTLGSAYSGHGFKDFQAAASVPDGSLIPNMVADYQGSFWRLADSYADRPWNELFIEEMDAGPTLVFRPAPFKSIDGDYILKGAVDPGALKLDIADVVSLEVCRSDSRVSNFFWVSPGQNSLNTNGFVTTAALQAGIPYEQGHANNDPSVYGIRQPMEHSTSLLCDGVPDPRAPISGDSLVDWHIQRMHDLRDMNHDNVALEEGSAIVKGSEMLKAGRYLQIARGTSTAEYYLTRVAHALGPYRAWTSSLTLERGDGFLRRVRGPKASYWAEGRKGPYDA